MQKLLTLAPLLFAFDTSHVHAGPDARFLIRVADKYGAIDASGTVVIAPQYDDEFRFSDGVARVRVGSGIL